MKRNSLINRIINIIGIKNTNRLRQLKWLILNPFINNKEQITKFYENEIDLRVLVALLPKML